jgi:hypothetical protein
MSLLSAGHSHRRTSGGKAESDMVHASLRQSLPTNKLDQENIK